jgi:hypothetical protein
MASSLTSQDLAVLRLSEPRSIQLTSLKALDRAAALRAGESDTKDFDQAIEDAREKGWASGLDKAFAAADIIALAIGAGTSGLGDTPATYAPHHAYQISQGMQMPLKARGAKRKAAEIGVKPNPWFVVNGHEDAPSPATQAYLYGRAWKSIAGTGVSVIGGFTSAFAHGINVGSTARHGSASASTVMHLLALRSIAASSRKGGTIAQWCDTIIRIKSSKLAVRGAQTIAAAVPVPLAGALINIAAAAGKLGYKINLGEICYMTAIEIHWRAFQEQAISRHGHGPATRILTEIFTRRTATRLLGAYDPKTLIREPAGWMALGDKLIQV